MSSSLPQILQFPASPGDQRIKIVILIKIKISFLIVTIDRASY